MQGRIILTLVSHFRATYKYTKNDNVVEPKTLGEQFQATRRRELLNLRQGSRSLSHEGSGGLKDNLRFTELNMHVCMRPLEVSSLNAHQKVSLRESVRE